MGVVSDTDKLVAKPAKEVAAEIIRLASMTGINTTEWSRPRETMTERRKGAR